MNACVLTYLIKIVKYNESVWTNKCLLAFLTCCMYIVKYTVHKKFIAPPEHVA